MEHFPLERQREMGLGARASAVLAILALSLTLACSGASYSDGGSSSDGGGSQGTAPPVPTGLTATAGNQQVSLSWAASSGAASYNVKRGSITGGPYTQIATPAGTSYVDLSLTNGTMYYYVVSALDSYDESANSTEASAMPVGAPDVTITVYPKQATPISPWIYGLNFYTGVKGAPPRLNLDRAGGNRWTAYNWETNASNAGSDYLYENDDYLSPSATPAEAIRSIIAADQGLGMASVMTVQLQGLVSADENGPVSIANPPGHDTLQNRGRHEEHGLERSVHP